jgi:hypothetical protein
MGNYLLAPPQQEGGSAPIFVVEEAHVMILHRQPSLKDPARKSWEAILGSRYFGPAKAMKETVGRGYGGQQISWHSTATSQEKQLMAT